LTFDDNQDVIQKGVDLLLAFDLINLSENGAISDAVLMTGDMDFQKAVEAAQNNGVRLHLIGLGSDRNEARVSSELYEEADTRSFWDNARMESLFEQ
jgi:uncharacterized LabA/DUF88 family protein